MMLNFVCYLDGIKNSGSIVRAAHPFPSLSREHKQELAFLNPELNIFAELTPEFKILTDFKILVFINPQFKILADFKILAFQKPKFTLLAYVNIVAFQNPEFKIQLQLKILAFRNPELKILAGLKILLFKNPRIWQTSRFKPFKTLFQDFV